MYLIGESALRAELEAADVTLVADPARADVVLASTDRSFDYGTLEDVLAADEAGGVVVYATNPDRTVPTETGERPDCGPVIGAIEGLREGDRSRSRQTLRGDDRGGSRAPRSRGRGV